MTSKLDRAHECQALYQWSSYSVAALNDARMCGMVDSDRLSWSSLSHWPRVRWHRASSLASSCRFRVKTRSRSNASVLSPASYMCFN